MTFYISPYRRMAAMRHAMNRMFEDGLAESAPAERELMLAMDVQDSDDDFLVTALVPGLQADDVEIEILNNTVTIRGEFKAWAEADSKYLLSELPEGRFARVVTLPTAVDAAKVEATIKDGVLTLRIPKAEAHRPKPIKVKTV